MGILGWLISEIPTLIRLGRRTHAALTEDDDKTPPDTALTYKDVEHIRKQMNAATSHKVVIKESHGKVEEDQKPSKTEQSDDNSG